MRERMSTLRVGPPLDKAIDIGPIVARVQLDRIRRMVTRASPRAQRAGSRKSHCRHAAFIIRPRC